MPELSDRDGLSDRDALIDVAERLFARGGVHGVSLREITRVADVRSKSAVQYHFGDRDGLVRAVLARRGETLRLRRAMFLESLVVAGTEADPREICRAIIEPYCDFLEDGPGAQAYLVIVREMLGDPKYAYEDLPSMFSDPLLPALLRRLLEPLQFPGPVAAERSWVVVSCIIGAVADRARRQLDESATRPITPVRLFVANLVDMLEGAALAPVAPATLHTVSRSGVARLPRARLQPKDHAMTFPDPTPITLRDPIGADEIVLSTHDIGEGPAVVFCHGFPDIAFGWRRQLSAVAGAGFRAIAPDQRGCGASSAPDDIEAYGLRELTGDLARLLDAKGIEDAVFVGHDWGGFVVWAMSVLHPDRVRGVAGLCTPYIPFPTVADHLKIVDGDAERQYVAWFQTDGVPEATMDDNVEAVQTRIFRSGTPLMEQAEFAFADGRLNMNPFLDPTAWPILGESLVDEVELAHYVATFERAGFRGGINWYRNIDRNAAELPDVGRRPLDIPCLMLTAECDPGLRPEYADGMGALVSDLTRHDLLGVGHWIQQEVPDQVNAHLINWLREKFTDV